MVPGDRHRAEHVAHGPEHVLHTLPTEEVEQTHLLPLLSRTTDEVGTGPAGQDDELVVAVHQAAVDGGNAQGDATRAEDVLVVQPTDEDQELVFGTADGSEGGTGDGGGGRRSSSCRSATTAATTTADGVGDDGGVAAATTDAATDSTPTTAGAAHGGRDVAPTGAGGSGAAAEPTPDGKVVGGGRGPRRRSPLEHVGGLLDGIEELAVLDVEQGLAALQRLDVVRDADQRGVLVGLELDVGVHEDVAEVVDLGGDLLGALLLPGVPVLPALGPVGFVLGHHGLGVFGRAGPLGPGGVVVVP